MDTLEISDIIGTIAFTLSGFMVATKDRLDLLGSSVLITIRKRSISTNLKLLSRCWTKKYLQRLLKVLIRIEAIRNLQKMNDEISQIPERVKKLKAK